MSKPKKSTIEVQGTAITILSQKQEDYICLTDIARFKDSERTDYIIMNWLRNRNTIEFLGIWEQLNNPDFKPIEFDGIRKQAGLNSFTLTRRVHSHGLAAERPAQATQCHCHPPDADAHARPERAAALAGKGWGR